MDSKCFIRIVVNSLLYECNYYMAGKNIRFITCGLMATPRDDPNHM